MRKEQIREAWVLILLSFICLGVCGVFVGYIHYKIEHSNPIEQTRKTLPELNYGWHSCDEEMEKTHFYFRGEEARIKFNDGCRAGWRESVGYWWMEYKHPVDIIDGKVVYLPKTQQK
jgi:hypothetical protein